MTKKWSFLFALFITSLCYAQTPVSGGIYTNTTWTLANSPYIMTAPIVVFPGKTLTIEPGVVIKVQDLGPNLGDQAYLEIRGNLNAVGTVNAPISFVGDSSTTTFSYPFWQGVKIQGDQGATFAVNYLNLAYSYYGLSNNVESNDSVNLKGCTFSNNVYGISMNAPLILDSCFFLKNNAAIAAMLLSGSVTANNCVFDQNEVHITTIQGIPFAPFGITLSNSTFSNSVNGIISVSGTIDNCSFLNNDFGLQDCGSLTITNTLFSNNGTAIKGLYNGSVQNCNFTGNGVALQLLDNSIVENNILNNNEIGLSLAGGTPGQLISNVKNNQICYNNLYNVENLTNLNLGVELNCFCETDSSVLETKIYDGYDDITRGLINYAVYDSSCQNILYYVQKVNLGPLSVEEAMTNRFSVSPNPAQSQITITCKATSYQPTPVQLLDLNGKIIKSEQLSSAQTTISINDLPQGLYIIRIENENIKFVKE